MKNKTSVANLMQSGTEALDPVCNMVIPLDDARWVTEHERQTYVFCSRMCLLEFENQPQTYLQRQHAQR